MFCCIVCSIRVPEDTEVYVCTRCKLVDITEFTKEEHEAECTIVNSNQDLQVHDHCVIKVTALKDSIVGTCVICHQNFMELKYLHLHLAKKHDLFDDQFQQVHLPYPFMDIAMDLIRK